MQSTAQGLITPQRTPLAKSLVKRIRAHGPLTFAEYMDACLYDPEHGYYTRADQPPRRDYFTNVDVSPLFARFIARQLEEMWRASGCPDDYWLVEAGAGRGELARAVLDFAAEALPDVYAALRYVAVERSDARRTAQSRLLAAHVQRGRFIAAAELPRHVPAGCIFSNELLDALPVHRVVQRGGQLKEVYVAFQNGELGEEEGELSSPRIGDYFARQGIALRDGQRAEAGLAAWDWIREAGVRLGRGFVLTIDYGREARELCDELHMQGTLLAYEGHRATEEFFRAPGDQDLTAHVNFTALDLGGTENGLARTGMTSQTNFLLALARGSNFADIDSDGATDEEKARRRLLFKTLIHPEGMGETFQAFVQHKGFATPPVLTGLKAL